MKYIFILVLFLVFSCNGTLTDDQRKKIKEDMAIHEIKKVTDAEVTDAAIRYGQQIATIIAKGDKTLSNQPFLDSISQLYQVEIVTLQKSNLKLRAVEKLILEAYASGQGSDNIQKMGPDSLLYTKPIMREHPDGSTEFIKALGLRMTRKQIVLTIK